MGDRRALVLGSKGMLGQELVRVFSSSDGRYAVVGWDIGDVDVADFPIAEAKIREYEPNIIVNAVAYNDVDRCEESNEEYARAVTLNAKVPELLARLAGEINSTLVHYSTDYVFDGACRDGYEESAVPHPLSRYGVSKRLGEEAVSAGGGRIYVIRLSRLFGESGVSVAGKKSFFEKMIDAATGKESVSVIDDEWSCFTYAPDLARATKALIEDDAPFGMYHLVNEGFATWCEAAKELYRLSGISVGIAPIKGAAFSRPAVRPKYSVLSNTRRPPLRPWQEALAEWLDYRVV